MREHEHPYGRADRIGIPVLIDLARMADHDRLLTQGRTFMTAATIAAGTAPERARPMTREEKKVILASSAGTVFEWYDFYLYGSLAATIGAQFFAPFPERPATSSLCSPSRGLPGAPVRARWCSAASATSSGASTPSSSPS
jgi:hypothetical protein